jgi:hypothetical protein
MIYTHIGGSIFRNRKQILVIVPVSGNPRTVDTITEELVTILNKRKPNVPRTSSSKRGVPPASRKRKP